MIVLRTIVVLLASIEDTPVPETLPVPVSVGLGLTAPSVLLAKGPLEIDDGSGPRPVPVVNRGTDERHPAPRHGVDVLGQPVLVMSLPLKVVTSDELTSYAVQPSSEPHVIEIILLLGWKEGPAAAAAVMLGVSSLHCEPSRSPAPSEH